MLEHVKLFYYVLDLLWYLITTASNTQKRYRK